MIGQQSQPAEIRPEPSQGDAAGSVDRDGAHEPATQPAAGVRPAPVQRWLAEHGDALWRFALSRTRSRDAAEDVVQETILAAMQSFGSFAGGSSERTWLLSIAAHKIADHFRAARRRAGASPSDDQFQTSREVDELMGLFSARGMWAKTPKAWGLNAGSASEKAEMLAALRSCIESLPPGQGEAVWLREVLRLPPTEVCNAMGITPTNLWSRMHRARAALRLCVEKALGMGQEGTE